MSRTAIPFAVGDMSALARSLQTQLAQSEAKPSHVSLLNMLARGAGFQNFQHFRSQTDREDDLADIQVPQPVDTKKIEKLARYYDATGRLVRWPPKESHRQICLWALWSHLPPRQTLSEKAINAVIEGNHLFGDYALLRREMVGRAMLWRTRDGREYRRIEGAPPPEACSLIRILKQRRKLHPKNDLTAS